MATKNKIKKSYESEFFNLLLDRAMGRQKLLTIAKESGVDSKSLTEFRRTGYLGKEKRQNLRDWLVVNCYLKRRVEPAVDYRTLLLHLQKGWKWLRENLGISIEEAARHTGTSETDIMEWENSIEPFLTFKQVQKFLTTVIDWSDSNLHSNFEGQKREEQIHLHYSFKAIMSGDHSNEEAELAIAAERQGQALDPLTGVNTTRKPDVREFEDLVYKLNSNIPQGCGPAVIADFACTNCDLWSPSVGDYCMHCGEKLEKPRQDESLFLVNKPEAKH